MSESINETKAVNYQPRSTRTMFLLGAIVLGGWALLIIFILYGNRNPDLPQPPGIGRKLENLQLQPLVGSDREVKLNDLSGKVVLLNFWGTWCGYCRVEMPNLVDIQARLKDRPDFQFVSVSCHGSVATEHEQELREETESYLKSKDYNFAVYHDRGGLTRQAIVELAELGQRGFVFPMTLVLDREGVIRAIFPGYSPAGAKEMSKTIDQLLAKT